MFDELRSTPRHRLPASLRIDLDGSDVAAEILRGFKALSPNGAGHQKGSLEAECAQIIVGMFLSTIPELNVVREERGAVSAENFFINMSPNITRESAREFRALMDDELRISAGAALDVIAKDESLEDILTHLIYTHEHKGALRGFTNILAQLKLFAEVARTTLLLPSAGLVPVERRPKWIAMRANKVVAKTFGGS